MSYETAVYKADGGDGLYFQSGATARHTIDSNNSVVFASTNTVTYTDTTAKNLFQIPANATILAIFVNVTTAFNDSGTDLLDIGITGTANHFKDNLDVSTVGQTVTGWSNLGSVGSSDITVTATYTGQNGDATAGSATITFLWTL